MRVITFAIQKGGTGKTSTAVSVAVEFAEKGKKVVVIDADPQGNATTWIGIEEISFEFADVLMKKCEVQQSIVQTKIDNLSFLPTASINGNLKLYSKTLANESPFAVRQCLKKIKDNYDYCIIDTSPAFGALEESCFLASDEAIPVLKLDEFSKEGLVSFLSNIESMQERYDTDKPKMNKIVLNGQDLRLVQQHSILQEIEQSTNSKLFIIPTDTAFSKAQSVHYPVQYLDSTKRKTLDVIKELTSAICNEETEN